jgi:hypothetical protein
VTDQLAAPTVMHEFLDIYADDPNRFIREVLGVGDDVFVQIVDGPRAGWRMQVQGIYPDQAELIAAYARRERRITKRSGHGVGKTTSLAWLLVHHAVCRFPQKAVCTAPTSKQLFDALYAETVTWFKKLPPTLAALYEIKSESIELRSAPTESFISFATSSAERPEALAGKHSAWVLLIVDEASGVPEAVFEAAVGSMSGHNACTVLAGNPVRTSGLFFDTHNKPEVMAMWTRLHVSCVGHPNVSDDFMRQVEATYGIDSNAYRVRVLGEFPKGEANTVIPWELIEAAFTREVKPLMVRPIWGVDVGLNQDPSCIAKRQGNVLQEETEEFRADDDLMKVVAWVKAKWDATLPSMRPNDINLDAIGMGAGVAHRLMELGLPARCINVSETAGMDGFPRLRDYLWWKGREWFQKKDCTIGGERADKTRWKDEKLGAELARPLYAPTPTGKIQVEGKRATIKRTKTKSPNRADAFLLTLASEAIVSNGEPAVPLSQQQPLKRVIKGIV